MRATRWKVLMVVVPRPFARKRLAVVKAAAAARRCGARVVLFNSFMVPQPVTDVPMDSREQIIASATRQRRERLATIAAEAGLPRDTECIVRWDFPVDEAVLKQVRLTRPDVLLTESHRHGRLARVLLANTDWELMRHCPCPVWFVREPLLPKMPRWLVAVDPRHARAKPARLDERLLGTARNAVRQLGGSISVVHACEVRPPEPSQKGSVSMAATRRQVLGLAARFGVGPGRCVVREGDASEVVAEEANRSQADVLVMGAVSRSLPQRPVIGGTAERAIDHVDCDVLVVKPADFEARHRTSVQRTRGKRTASARAQRSAASPRP